MPNTPLPQFKSFPTKTGQCHIYPDRIEVVRSGWRGNLASMLFGKGIHRIFGIYAILIVILILALLVSLTLQNYLLTAFFGVMSLYYAWALIKSRDLSAAPVIYRDQIDSVDFNPAVKGVARAHFVVHYRTKRGKKLRRLIPMPGTMSSGDMVIQSAERIMREEGLLS